jgi:hypothetical protein
MYGYDELGRVANRSINGAANAASVQYDSLDRVQNVTNLLGSFNYAYVNRTGRLDHVDLPNGQKTQYMYFDNFGDQRLKQIKDPEGDGDEPQKKKREAAPGVRHRKEKKEVEVNEVPPPNLKELGTLTRYTADIIEGGPRALISAEHKAQRLAERLGIEIEAQWVLATPYLQKLKASAPRDARYALAWRPRYLAVLSLTRSNIFACRAAKISMMTPHRHRQNDPEFAHQCEMAEEHAIELLHDVTMKSAIEGELKPVYWQGIRVGYIREVDNRLRIEMLRAHKPLTFKTPGSKIAINSGNVTNNTMIVDSEEQDRLIDLRRQSLQRMQERKLLPITVSQELP